MLLKIYLHFCLILFLTLNPRVSYNKTKIYVWLNKSFIAET